MKNWFDDTLFKRLFLLMWVALVLSHLAGYISVQQFFPQPEGGPPHAAGLPPMPSLPPMGGPRERGGPPPERGGPPPEGGPPDGPPSRPPDGRPDGPPDGPAMGHWLWLDFLVRGLAIGAAAWFGARWLSAPMRRLADASRALGQALGSGRLAPALDEQRGTREVRQTAEVFNTMARHLHEQFSAQALLMAAMSHDLRTPLARLRLRLEQLDAVPPGPATERCIADVREMDQLIASVLEMMRLGHESIAYQLVDVRALVQALVDDLIEQGQALTLSSAADTSPAVVSGQNAALARVIGNLVNNALRHGGSADVAVRRQPGQVAVMVDDRGPGIPADQLEAVFQPFYRVDSSRSKHTGGTGLGLYIARDLARRHGGQVTLANRSEGGLRAMLVLPLAR
jgi:signal transduction histidine kinase